jgi:hypothetical protein
MTRARLASSVIVAALLRRAQNEGGFGAVISKGDPMAGAVAVILAEKGRRACFLERLLGPDGRYSWEESRQKAEDELEFQQFLDRRRRYDPDLWILELDIASAERFAAEMNAIG